MTDSLGSSSSSSSSNRRGKSTRTKRPRVDPNFVTGEGLEDDNADPVAGDDDDDDELLLLGKKKKKVKVEAKVVKKKVLVVKKPVKKKKKNAAKKSGKVITEEEGTEEGTEEEASKAAEPGSGVVVETGETVIVALKCSEPDCNEMLATRAEFNRHLLYIHLKYPYACLAAHCQKEFQIM